MADVYSIIVDFLHKGGFFIYPISLVFVIGLAIALERWIYLQYEKSRNSQAFIDFLPLLKETKKEKDIDKMRAYVREKASAPVVRVIGCGLDMLDVSKQRTDVENAMSEGMLETMPRLEQRTNYLGLLANVATLLGLLGTIIGLIGAFEAVAQADPSEKSQMLSTSISVAMNTTAVGLITAIPLLILNGLLQNKTKAIVTGIEMSAVKFLNVMTLNRLIEAGAPRVVSGEGGAGAMASGLSSVRKVSDETAARPVAREEKKDSSETLAVRIQKMEAAESAAQTQSEAEQPSASGAESQSKGEPQAVAAPSAGAAIATGEAGNPQENGVHISLSSAADQGAVSYSQSVSGEGVQVTAAAEESSVNSPEEVAMHVDSDERVVLPGAAESGDSLNKDKNNLISGAS